MAERFRHNGTWWVPTLGIMPSVKKIYPLPFQPAADTIAAHFRTFSKAFWEDSVLHRYPLDTASILAMRSPRPDSAGLLWVAARAGLPILSGTDANLFNPFVSFLPGFGIHVELAIYVVEGLTPAEALQTSILNSARYIHATDSLGAVAPGMLADLILLDADPLADITNTQRIWAVIANGRYFDRAALDAQLRAAQEAHEEWEANWQTWKDSWLPGGQLPGALRDP